MGGSRVRLLDALEGSPQAGALPGSMSWGLGNPLLTTMY